MAVLLTRLQAALPCWATLPLHGLRASGDALQWTWPPSHSRIYHQRRIKRASATMQAAICTSAVRCGPPTPASSRQAHQRQLAAAYGAVQRQVRPLLALGRVAATAAAATRCRLRVAARLCLLYSTCPPTPPYTCYRHGSGAWQRRQGRRSRRRNRCPTPIGRQRCPPATLGRASSLRWWASWPAWPFPSSQRQRWALVSGAANKSLEQGLQQGLLCSGCCVACSHVSMVSQRPAAPTCCRPVCDLHLQRGAALRVFMQLR